MGALLLSLVLAASPARADDALDPDAPGVEDARAGQAKPEGSGLARLLLVGDSHSTQVFGRTLDRELRRLPLEVATYAVCSSGPKSWLKGKEHGCGHFFRGVDGRRPRTGVELRTEVRGGREVTLVKTPLYKALLAEHKADLVVIALGSNPTDEAGVRGMLELVVGQDPPAGGRKCVWVGPPYMRESVKSKEYVDGVYGILGSVLRGSCAVADSRSYEFLRYPDDPDQPGAGGDGIHYACLNRKSPKWRAVCSTLDELGERWARSALGDVKTALSL